VSPEPFRYDNETESYHATWEDCLLTGTDVGYDDRHRLSVDIRATLPTGILLNHKRLRLLDIWACQEFAKECDARPDAQMKMRQYLTQFADWLQQQCRSVDQPVQQYMQEHRNGHGPAVLHMPLTPALPEEALLHPELAEGAAPWLDAYCEHSRTWAPRAAQGFHQAIGLWVLSTISARRVCVHLGKPHFPMLFIALIAPSTLYTKTTTAHVGRKGITDAGCKFLLTPDRITPQALIRRMSGKIEDDYGNLDEDEQNIRRRDLAFAGQRGWYYEEWGTLLHQIRRQDSVMTEFHGMLKVLDDASDDFSNETILRGLEYVKDPALALLASATPADLAPFMRPGNPWWRDGFWARFAFVTPLIDEKPSLADLPRGLDALPSELVVSLHAWHKQLGIPEFSVEGVFDHKGNSTGTWKGKRAAFQPQVLTIPDDVLGAYRSYNKALMSMVINGTVSPDLSGCYGRYHDKALRIATLLASFNNSSSIQFMHWAYAQQVVESWRAMLHNLLQTAAESEPMSREQMWEEKIEQLLSSRGAMTARELQQQMFRCTSQDLQRLLASMVNIGRIVAIPKGKTALYMVPMDAPPAEQENAKEENDDVPF
jgi:Protein of unknown function (DUF3987)